MRIWSDARFALRALRRAPLFTATAILTLALGIGATAAIFSVLNAVLLKPLNFEASERLVSVWHVAPGLGIDRVNQSTATYLTYRQEARAFEEFAIWSNTEATVTGLAEPERVRAKLVTEGLFSVLAARPAIGQAFSDQDVAPGAPPTVILSHGYWQRRLGGDPGAIGRSLSIDGNSCLIIGVMPAGFRFLTIEPALYLPLTIDPARAGMTNFRYNSVARLSPSVSLPEAEADVARMIPIAMERFPRGMTPKMLEEARFGPAVRQLKAEVVGDVGKVLWILLGTVGIVLLIACANVANLFLVRAEVRQQVFAIRTALGATGRQVASVILLESLLLSLVGGAAGLGLAHLGIRLLVSIGPRDLPRLADISIDPSVLAFTLSVSILSGISLGLFPILKNQGSHLVTALKEGGRRASQAKERQRTRSLLVAAQIALALVLLIGAGLMIRSYQALWRVDPGFKDPDQVVTFRIFVPASQADSSEAAVRAHEQILRHIEQIPGVESASLSSRVTMGGGSAGDAFTVEGFPVPQGQLPPVSRFKLVSPQYFETMKNPLLAGRPITWADVQSGARVSVVTENFAREYWDGPAAAIGKRFHGSQAVSGGEGSQVRWHEIVGVVGNVHDDGVDKPQPTVVYWPLLVPDYGGQRHYTQRSMDHVVRVAQPITPGLLQQFRQAVWSVNRNLPLTSIRTLEEVMAGSTARASFTLTLLAIASAMALVLAMVGIYGVISYVVAQRRREIGIRMALGASHRSVSHLVLRQGWMVALSGIVIGLAAATLLTRFMSALLYGVSAADPLTYVVAAAAIILVSLTASYLPARRAGNIDPQQMLRCE